MPMVSLTPFSTLSEPLSHPSLTSPTSIQGESVLHVRCVSHPFLDPFQPLSHPSLTALTSIQGEPVLQDMEAAEVCGGPHADDCHC